MHSVDRGCAWWLHQLAVEAIAAGVLDATVDEALHVAIKRTVTALGAVGARWLQQGEQWRPAGAGSAGGTAEPSAAELGAYFPVMATMTIDEAAGLLGVTPRRVRTLAPDLGCKVASTWQLDRVLVAALMARRSRST